MPEDEFNIISYAGAKKLPINFKVYDAAAARNHVITLE
jgi:hypothetical protein